MNREHIIDVLNTLNTLYPMAFNNLSSERRREIYIQQFTKHLGDLAYIDVQSAIDNWVANDEQGKSPTVSVLKTKAKQERDKRLSKEGRGERRIVTPEEEMFNTYLEEMKLPMEQRNEWLIKQCLPYAAMFQDTEESRELYKKHFGAYREEYERI